MSSMSSDLKWLNGLLKKKGVDITLRVNWCPDIDRQRARGNKTAHAHLLHKPRLLCHSEALLSAPTKVRRGVLAHEVGHKLLIQRGKLDHAEHEADEIVREVLGIKIRYKNGLQTL